MTKYYCNYCNFRSIRKFRLDNHLITEHKCKLENNDNDKKIILIYYQKSNNENIIKSINSFKKNFKNYNLIKKQICILKDKIYIEKINLINKFDDYIINNKFNFNFTKLINQILDYDYLIFMNDSFNLIEEFNIFKKLNIFFNNIKYKQLIFIQNNNNNQIVNYYNNVFTKSIFIDLNYLDPYYIHKNIDIRPEKNIYKNNYIKINHLDYLNKKYVNWPYFKLEPSIIKTCIFRKIKTELNTNIYLQRYFSYDYYKNNYISINLSEKIMEKNNNIPYIKNNYNEMTVVTGFIYINKDEGFKKHKYNYMEKSKSTLELENYLYIYVSKNLEEHVYQFRKNKGLENKTKIIIVDEKDLYLFDKINEIRKNSIKNIPTYQNPLYIMAVNSRYKFIKRCIEENPFNSKYFSWIDFSAGHIVNFPKINKICYNRNDKIRLAWIGRCKIKKKKMSYHHSAMGGGVFAGHKDIMLEFIKLHDIYFKKFMEFGYNINDDKLLFFMFEKHPELFDYYFSSYHDILLKL